MQTLLARKQRLLNRQENVGPRKREEIECELEQNVDTPFSFLDEGGGMGACCLPDPADRHAAPEHLVIVSAALAVDCGGAESEGFGGGHARP